MRQIETWADKAKLAGEISDLICTLQHPLNNKNDVNSSLSIVLRERGERTSKLYGEFRYANIYGIPNFTNTHYDNKEFALDIETRDCLITALKERLENLKKDIQYGL